MTGSFRLILSCLTIFSCMTAARASDGANFNPVGFSADGRYFAFEQYGVGDPSGFPYWQATVIDTAKNADADGSPVSVVVEDNTHTVLDARKRAEKPELALLKAAAIAEPYALLAANPNTELVADRRSVTFERWYNSGGVDANLLAFADLRYELRIDDSAVAKPGQCDSAAGPYRGVTLKLRDMARKQWKTLYTEGSLPAARGCAVSYDLAAVVGRTAVSSDDWLIAIIGVYTPGFQGLDHRYFAIPFTLSH